MVLCGISLNLLNVDEFFAMIILELVSINQELKNVLLPIHVGALYIALKSRSVNSTSSPGFKYFAKPTSMPEGSSVKFFFLLLLRDSFKPWRIRLNIFSYQNLGDLNGI